MKINDILNTKDVDINEVYMVLNEILNMSTPEIKLNRNKTLTKKEYKKIYTVIKKIKNGIPAQYALKKAYFYGFSFYVDKNVLIPRPETELLVEKTNELINKNFKKEKVKILDIGTGSGVIGITLSKLNKKRIVVATDISSVALKIAKKNSKLNNACVQYKKTNLYDKVNMKFNVIISNPPYIKKDSLDIEERVKRTEPHLALYAKNDGLYYYEEILKNIKDIIEKEHIIAFEIGENQVQKIKKIIKRELPDEKIIVKKDYNNFDRYMFIMPKNWTK